jgi:mono/diheme cytochrome c family protein
VNTTSRSSRASSRRSPQARTHTARGRGAAGAALLSLWAFGCSEALDAVDGGGEGFASIYESDEFQTCSGCHAPGAPGKVSGTEATQDWSTQATADASLQRTASGLIGNFAGCNGVPFIGSSADQSLLVAVFDSDVRANFENAQFPSCNADAITDETLRLGRDLPAGLLQDLKDWIDGGG